MFCKNCGEAMNDGQAICVKCGVKVGEGSAFCQNCGQPVSPEAEFCLNCGAATRRKAAAVGGKEYGKYDKVAIAFICFLVGSIGIHNFMLGENKKGILKIVLTVCCGLGSILALIDLIRILLDSYEVDPEKLF